MQRVWKGGHVRMTKSYWIILISLFCALALMIVLVFSLTPAYNRYPLVGRVFAIDSVHDVVFFVDGAGVSWSFRGVEDWCNGDYVACIMNDMGTESIYDDQIISVKYGGIL
jgi:hypothetical protein